MPPLEAANIQGKASPNRSYFQAMLMADDEVKCVSENKGWKDERGDQGINDGFEKSIDI